MNLRLLAPLFVLIISTTILCAQGKSYNEVRRIACHNCFEKKYAPNIEDALSHVNAIEIDIWDSRWLSGGWKARDRNWYVKHGPEVKGDDNCCGGSFVDCLNRVKAWSNSNPGHSVITIFIDKKENRSRPNELRKPQDLDEVLIKIFSKERIYTPSDLTKFNEGRIDNAIKITWPSIDDLQGKFIFVITKSTLITPRNVLNEYMDSQLGKEVCFVAPQVFRPEQVGSPEGVSSENATRIFFYNLEYPHQNVASVLTSRGLISRIFNSPESVEEANKLLALGINFVALYNYRLR